MKKHPLFYVPLLVLLLNSLVGINIYASQKPPPIPSQGMINYSPMTVHMRGIWLSTFSTADEVDSFVYDYPYSNVIHLVDGSNHILNVISYTGWNATRKWDANGGGLTYGELKTVIDRFHYHGWRVVLESATRPSKSEAFWHYINDTHRELAFTDGNGQLKGCLGENGKGGKMIPDFFKNFTTADPVRNINVGDRLADLYTNRLMQMIQDGSFVWDGWFGTDGWNGFSGAACDYMNWLSPKQYWYGRWIGTDNKVNWYSFSYQEIAEWGNSSFVPGGFPPAGWETWNNTERGDWIRSNCPIKWFYYWQYRFAQFYHQINQVFSDTGRTIGTIYPEDASVSWVEGHMGPEGMNNWTCFFEENSFNHYWVDSEATFAENFKVQAWVAGHLRSKYPEFHVVPKIQPSSWGKNLTTAFMKMEYLAQCLTYVWKNGTQYRAVDPSHIIMLGDHWVSRKDRDRVNEVLQWCQAVASLLNNPNFEPVNIGPTFILGPYREDGVVWDARQLKYTFIQFADFKWLDKHPEYIKDDMNCLFYENTLSVNNEGWPSGLSGTVLNKFTKGNLSIYLWTARNYMISKVWAGDGEDESTSILQMSSFSQGSSQFMIVGSETQITDPYARWIASGCFGDTYDIGEGGHNGLYEPATGFISIANFTDVDPRIGIGMYYNSSSARFFYVRGSWSSTFNMSSELLARSLYWSTFSPINNSEPLIDTYVFNVSGTILLSMINHKTIENGWDDGSNTQTELSNPVSMTLEINASRLGLGNPSNYYVYWLSDYNRKNVISVSDWDDLDITLNDGADILIIRPKDY